MLTAFLSIYRWLFARVFFIKLNKFLYLCSLHGLGILNFGSDRISGERRFLVTYLKKLPQGACVIDVGANVGNYSKSVLEVAPTAQLYAFEPHPKSFEKLARSILGENFFPINAAVVFPCPYHPANNSMNSSNSIHGWKKSKKAGSEMTPSPFGRGRTHTSCFSGSQAHQTGS